MRVGLFGGAFDPVHFGHLRLAEAAAEHHQLDRVLWLPSGVPPHKAAPVAPAESRAAMVELAIRGNPRFQLSRLEMERVGPSYTIDTLHHFQHEFPGAELYFIIGSDAVLDLPAWRQPEEVVRRCLLLVAAREGFGSQDLDEALPAAYVERIRILPPSPYRLSSSELRRLLSQGASARYLLPDAVREYILDNGLYSHSAVGGRG